MVCPHAPPGRRSAISLLCGHEDQLSKVSLTQSMPWRFAAIPDVAVLVDRFGLCIPCRKDP